ncbi:MAG TPA: hypothetical protein VGO52_22155 [Hyphomonadaceae bacterium]|jgi:short-subunit dehydrogenase|nr:hypothetical protein [Hyphomonadaceae bacterium]
MKPFLTRNRTKDTVLITGALSTTGAAYAERFARLGHNLILVAPDFTELEDFARRLWAQTGVNVEIDVADFSNAPDLARIEHRLSADPKIGLFVNAVDAERGSHLDVVAATRLAIVAAHAFDGRRRGSVVNPAPAEAASFPAEVAHKRFMTIFGARPAA